MSILFPKKHKVALALGGGSARGFANLGVLKVLQREMVPIDMIVGSSIGAVIGACYALGIPLSKLQRDAINFSWRRLIDMQIPKIGLIKGERLAKVIEAITEKKGFPDMRIPFAAITTDIETGDEIAHSQGDLQKVLQASCSWPGIFEPVRVEGRLLVDGGIRNSIPVKMARLLGADFVIAVKIGFVVKKGKIKNIFQIWVQSIQILGEELDRYQSMQADVSIVPEMPDIDQLAFDRAADAIIAGEEAAIMAIPHLKRLLGLK